LELTKLKSKGQVQPSQDNCDIMVKKLEKRSNVTTSALQQGQVKKRKIQEKEECLVQINLVILRISSCSPISSFSARHLPISLTPFSCNLRCGLRWSIILVVIPSYSIARLWKLRNLLARKARKRVAAVFPRQGALRG
jgi:hypothetical protein